MSQMMEFYVAYLTTLSITRAVKCCVLGLYVNCKIFGRKRSMLIDVISGVAVGIRNEYLLNTSLE
jgi:hypothetical protein